MTNRAFELKVWRVTLCLILLAATIVLFVMNIDTQHAVGSISADDECATHDIVCVYAAWPLVHRLAPHARSQSRSTTRKI